MNDPRPASDRHADARPGFLSLQAVHKHYGGDFRVEIADLQVAKGEVMSLLGPSGCGKTTTLRLVAGLDMPETGRIHVAGQEVYSERVFVPSERRKVGLVFQDYALFPHLTVDQNIRFGLRHYAGDTRARIEHMLELTRLTALRGHYPHELSGGEQQRTALARSLAPEPHVLLMDEPFSNLDAVLRKELRTEVRRILRETRVTTVLVTHDQEEALSMSDRLAVILQGQVQQIGTPRELYWSPRSEAVAHFIGDANLLPGMASGHQVQCVLGTLPIQKQAEGPVQVMVRPESVRVLLGGERTIPGRILDIEYYGHDQVLSIQLDSGENLLARRDAIQPFLPGQQVSVEPVGVFPVYPQ